MENFIKKSDNNIIEERISIVKKKVSESNNSVWHKENIRSYVRIQYILGEPCWGKCSPINNFSRRIFYKVNNPQL